MCCVYHVLSVMCCVRGGLIDQLNYRPTAGLSSHWWVGPWTLIALSLPQPSPAQPSPAQPRHGHGLIRLLQHRIIEWRASIGHSKLVNTFATHQLVASWHYLHHFYPTRYLSCSHVVSANYQIKINPYMYPCGRAHAAAARARISSLITTSFSLLSRNTEHIQHSVSIVWA